MCGPIAGSNVTREFKRSTSTPDADRSLFTYGRIFAMKFHLWHTLLSFFFIALSVFAYCYLAAVDRLGTWIPFTDFVLMALAVFRLVRLFTYDNITAHIRELFANKDPNSFMGSLGTIVNCPWCTGLWSALLVVFFYFLTPVAWYFILLLALAAAGTFLQLVANLIGWSAELKKKEAQSMTLPR